MSKKSWVAMAGLGVLMATSAAQAHLIPICVEAYESGIEVSGASTRSHVTFTAAGKSSAVPAGGDKSPYWSASSGAGGNCLRRALSDAGLQAQSSQAPGEGPNVELRLVPVTAALVEASLDEVTDVVGLDATAQTFSPWGWSVQAGNRLALASVNTISQGLGHLTGSLSSGGSIGRIPLPTSNAAIGSRPTGPSAAAGTNNGNTGGNPVGGKNGQSAGDNAQTTKVPEPETLALLMVGLLGVALSGRRRRMTVAEG